jgi:hypothetical protein
MNFFEKVTILSSPKTKERVVFQCDEFYFKNYAFYNLLSCNDVGYDVHIHFINPTDEFLEKVQKINLSIDLSISVESLDITDINFYKLKSYYFCSRYFISNLLFENNLIDKAYIVDADIIFNEKIIIPENKLIGVMYYPSFDDLWKQTGANFLYVSEKRKDFLKKIIKEYKQRVEEIDFDSISNSMNKSTRANLYGLDQVCMSFIIKNENLIDDSFLNMESIERFIGNKDTTKKIWSLTGQPKRNPDGLKEVLYKRFGQEF